jgi:hypothetical protein
MGGDLTKIFKIFYLNFSVLFEQQLLVVAAMRYHSILTSIIASGSGTLLRYLPCKNPQKWHACFQGHLEGFSGSKSSLKGLEG